MKLTYKHIYVKIVYFLYCLLIELDVLLYIEIIIGRLTLKGKFFVLFSFLPFPLSFPLSNHLSFSNKIVEASTQNLDHPGWISDLPSKFYQGYNQSSLGAKLWWGSVSSLEAVFEFSLTESDSSQYANTDNRWQKQQWVFFLESWGGRDQYMLPEVP